MDNERKYAYGYQFLWFFAFTSALFALAMGNLPWVITLVITFTTMGIWGFYWGRFCYMEGRRDQHIVENESQEGKDDE